MVGKVKKILYPLYNWYLFLRGWLFLLIYPKGELYCMFCGHSFKNFTSYGSKEAVFKKYKIIGGGYRKNCFCPFCFSSNRERMIYLFLLRENLLIDNINILHIAPERNLQKKLLKHKNSKYYSVDISAPRAEYKMNIEKLSFPDNYFDLIICSHVLEHVDNDIQAMQELFRVLRPNGKAILQVPFSEEIEDVLEQPGIDNPQKQEQLFGDKDHKRLYGKGYFKRLKSVGFSVRKARLSKEDYLKYALDPKESIFLVSKL